MLARQGAHLDQVDYDCRTAMHKACLAGNYKCVEVLIQNHADVNIKDRWGQVTLELFSKSPENEFSIFCSESLTCLSLFLAFFLTDSIPSGSQFKATDDYQFASGLKSKT